MRAPGFGGESFVSKTFGGKGTPMRAQMIMEIRTERAGVVCAPTCLLYYK